MTDEVDRPAGRLAQGAPQESLHGEGRLALRGLLARHFGIDDVGLLDAVVADARLMALRAGETLFAQGDNADAVYFVLQGRLRALAGDGNGGRRALGDIARGETIGELGMISGAPRSASVVAIRDTTLAQLSRGAFERAFARAPSLAMGVTRLIIERFRQQEQTRRRAAAPAVVAMRALTPDVDLRAFAEALRAQFRHPEGVAIVGARDVGADTAAMDAQDVMARLRRIEAAHETTLTLAHDADGAWSQLCLQEADEIVLVAHADAFDALHAAYDASGEGAGEGRSLQRRTLVLLQDATAASPRDTPRWLDRIGVDRHAHVRAQRADDLRRLARMLSGRAIGLVLSGGAARGLAQIGVLQALDEAGLEADFVGGTSMGSIIAAWYAMGLRGEALSRAAHRVFGINPISDYNWLPLISLVRGRRVMEITRNEILAAAGADIDTTDTWLPFFCVASNYTAAAEAVLTRGLLSRNVVASYSIPGLFPPQIVDGHILFDGGTFNNFPVDAMERMGAAKIVGVDMLPDARKPIDLDEAPGGLAFALDLMRPATRRRYRVPTLNETLLAATFVSATAKQRDMRARVDLYIRPNVTGVSMLGWKKLPRIVQMGYAHARAQLAAMSADELDAFR